MQTKNQKALSSGIAVIVAMLVAFGIQSYLKKLNDPTSLRILNKIASEYNKSLPMMIDNETQLTSVSALDKEVIYYYKLVSLDSSDDLVSKISQMKPRMINHNCSTPDTRDNFLKKGITMEYRYYDKSDKHLVDIDIFPSDCLQFSN
jgi:hypothetical protein